MEFGGEYFSLYNNRTLEKSQYGFLHLKKGQKQINPIFDINVAIQLNLKFTGSYYEKGNIFQRKNMLSDAIVNDKKGF